MVETVHFVPSVGSYNYFIHISSVLYLLITVLKQILFNQMFHYTMEGNYKKNSINKQIGTLISWKSNLYTFQV